MGRGKGLRPSSWATTVTYAGRVATGGFRRVILAFGSPRLGSECAEGAPEQPFCQPKTKSSRNQICTLQLCSFLPSLILPSLGCHRWRRGQLHYLNSMQHGSESGCYRWFHGSRTGVWRRNDDQRGVSHMWQGVYSPPYHHLQLRTARSRSDKRLSLI